MANDRVDMLATAYEAAIKSTLGDAAKIPAEKRMKQPQAGKGHPLWHLGHLTFAFDVITNVMALGGASIAPAVYSKRFAPAFVGGDAITSNADDYPDWDEVVSNYEKAGNAVVASIRELQDADLAGGPKGSPPEAMVDFFKVLGVTLASMASHDSYHRGQMNLVAALD